MTRGDRSRRRGLLGVSTGSMLTIAALLSLPSTTTSRLARRATRRNTGNRFHPGRPRATTPSGLHGKASDQSKGDLYR